jgi:hypothetical protein
LGVTVSAADELAAKQQAGLAPYDKP